MGNLTNTVQTTPAWGDLTARSQDALTLRQGRAWLLATILNHSTRGQEMIGFWPATTLGSSPNCALYTNANFLRARGGANTGGREVDYSASTEYPIAVAWTKTGYQVFSKRGDDWYRDWHIHQSDLANYAGLSIYDSVGSIVDRFVVRDRNAALFAFDVDIESPAIGDGSYAGGSEAQLPAYEFYAEFDYDVEPTDGYIVLAYQFVTIDGVDSFYFFRIDSSSNLSWGQAFDGVYEDYYDNPDPIPTITPGSTIRIFIDWDGLRIFENETEIFFYDDTAAYYDIFDEGFSNHDWSILDLVVGGEISNLKIGKRRLRDESGLGTDVVINGDFDTDTDWIKEGGAWTIAAGVASHANVGATDFAIRADNAPFTTGRLYKGQFDVTGAAPFPASVLLDIDAGSPYSDTFVSDVSEDGTFTGINWCRDSSLTKPRVLGREAYVGDIDNVIFQEILFSPDELANILNSMLS